MTTETMVDHQIGNQRVLDKVGRNLDPGRMKIVVVPAAVWALSDRR